jgi:hypothetical protein
VKVPLLKRIFRKCFDGREIGDVNFNDSVIRQNQTGGVTVRMDGRSDNIAELVAHKLLFLGGNKKEKYFKDLLFSLRRIDCKLPRWNTFKEEETKGNG